MYTQNKDSGWKNTSTTNKKSQSNCADLTDVTVKQQLDVSQSHAWAKWPRYGILTRKLVLWMVIAGHTLTGEIITDFAVSTSYHNARIKQCVHATVNTIEEYVTRENGKSSPNLTKYPWRCEFKTKATMQGPNKVNVNKIVGLANPTVAREAATKDYVVTKDHEIVLH
ncbi:hypothetical protein CHS0354_024479 [Potamilus streckersoni]|uniref:Uncharacterized protein n=1 Tax=Potamilus streckersoni TaxID=2493646 RepID=A0AAE0WGB4_9BIVA|nr:hypothetical protein CHS0354_024479 [Potamilus streckersoni]